ncbi:MAG: hypothetical protein K6A43_06555 [Treponema sp.]|nr:hypothetical protein [Treponema sp.]
MKRFNVISTLAAAVLFTSCYSVFSGGTGGQIVDAESTSNPKRGIAYVEVYAYTDSAARDSDFKAWQEGTIFTPSDTYYGHTTTDSNGSFSISKLVWKETKPFFGKDADFTTIYLLYFHENYGLTKDKTVITSDSTSDSIYAELTAIKKTTSLNIKIYDVSTSNTFNDNVLVTVSVPQSTDTLSTSPKNYEEIISGSGTISISYPRWKTQEDKTNGIENKPQISIKYTQSADEITWKACANADNDEKDYSFLSDDFEITKTVENSSYSVSLYGKATKIKVPTVNGNYGDSTAESSDGIVISMKAKKSDANSTTGSGEEYTIDCGETTTQSQSIGTSGTQTHGNFSGLGSGFYWIDNSYNQKFTTIDVQFFADGVATGIIKTLRSDTQSYNFNLNQVQADD